MPRNDAILWIDLETTGSSDAAKIIEFGAILTDATPQFNVLGEFTTPVWDDSYGDVKVPEAYEAPIVVEMHKKSGLTQDILDGKTMDLVTTDRAVIKWINDTIGFSSEHIPWGGSGVGHFDAKYIRRDMPFLSKKITYWVYDVGVIRRALRLVGINLDVQGAEDKPHRALDDIKIHAEEARQYLQQISWWRDFYKLSTNLDKAISDYEHEKK